MSSGAELHFCRTAVELQPIDMIHATKDEQRCRRHATKMKLRGNLGQDATKDEQR